MERAPDVDTLRGHEGMAGKLYFSALLVLLDQSQPLRHFAGRNRRPPEDPFNAALSFGYSLLYRANENDFFRGGYQDSTRSSDVAKSAAPLKANVAHAFAR